jgi:hypothetical protein
MTTYSLDLFKIYRTRKDYRPRKFGVTLIPDTPKVDILNECAKRVLLLKRSIEVLRLSVKAKKSVSNKKSSQTFFNPGLDSTQKEQSQPISYTPQYSHATTINHLTQIPNREGYTFSCLSSIALISSTSCAIPPSTQSSIRWGITSSLPRH